MISRHASKSAKLHIEAEEHLLKGDIDGAAARYENAIDIDPQDHVALAGLGNILANEKQMDIAAGYFMLAIQSEPSVPEYKQGFVKTCFGGVFNQYNPNIEKTLVACFADDAVDCGDAQSVWHTTFALHPVLAKACGYSFNGTDFKFDRTVFDASLPLDLLAQSDFFLAGLRRIVVYSTVFEDFIAHLRKSLLEKGISEKHAPLAGTLSAYAFETDYLVFETPDEQPKIDELKKKIESGNVDDFSMSLLACYRPLHALSNAKDIIAQSGNLPISGAVIKTQLSDYIENEKTRSTIPALTSIDNDISKKVREQYEASPYPRWKSIDQHIFNAGILSLGRGKDINMLVAGCGTGREACIYAAAMPEAKITAIDLSTASLAYARTMAEKTGLKNISFHQADILKIGEVGISFDVISCGGVLHHMQDPMQGFKALTAVLKPGGFFRVALYSELARKEIVAAHRVIADKGYSSTLEGMRRFRNDLRKNMDERSALFIERSSDYYRAATCRDLLFHEMEHRFTIPQIKETLATLGLSFMGFQRDADGVADLYAKTYKTDPQGINLDNWAVFEQAHPSIFRGMYQFWCKKNLTVDLLLRSEK